MLQIFRLIRPIVILIATATLVACQGNETDEYGPDEVRVYFIEWHITSRFAYNPSDLRGFADSVVTDQNATAVYKLVKAETTKSDVNPICRTAKLDGRLLVEAKLSNGNTELYFGDRFCLCNLETQRCVENNPQTKSEVSDLLDSD